MISEYDNGAAVGSPSREYIYSGGALIAKIENSATVYYHQDGLSARIMTDSSGNVVTLICPPAPRTGSYDTRIAWLHDFYLRQ